MRSILIWRDGNETIQDVPSGEYIDVRSASGKDTRFHRVGVRTTMFLYVEVATVRDLHVVPEPERAS